MKKSGIKSKEEVVAEMAEKVNMEEAEIGKIMYSLDENYELSLSYITKDEEKGELKTISLEAEDE
jgi:predicted transcriptional regulator